MSCYDVAYHYQIKQQDQQSKIHKDDAASTHSIHWTDNCDIKQHETPYIWLINIDNNL